MTFNAFPISNTHANKSLALPAGPIIVATDGELNSEASFRLAEVLASRTRAEIETVSVEAHANEGASAEALADVAIARDARVILLGRGRQKGLNRSMGSLVARLLHDGDRPVLAVDPEMTWLPRRIVICTDFSDYSAHAARIALTMVARDAKVLLLNVGPGFDETDPTERERAVAYRRQAEMRMARIHEVLDRADVQIEEVFRNGVAVDEILRVADDFQADLIVSSTHGHGFVRRMLLGSVAQGLLRGAWCSVLCVPGSSRTNAMQSVGAG